MNSEDGVNLSSHSNKHHPMEKIFVDQKIKEFIILEIGYRDNSDGAVRVPFGPYTVTLIIKEDSEIIAEKQFAVMESGHVDSVNYIFQ